MDKFDIIKILGQGSFGSALLVEESITKKHLVVKRIALFNMNKKEKEEAMKEVEVLSQLKHPNIILYHKSFVEDLNLYIVTDYCNGGDLYTKIKSQNGVYFKEDEILDWFVQICLAVKHVHDRRILHRDIKTQNIFLTTSGIAKLGDFGIARILSNTTELAQTCIGSPFYLSPEICENKPYNNKTDIWSLGCVLYELTTLKHAFEAKSLKNLFFKILRGTLPQIPDIYTNELKSLLSDIFVRNAKDRPSVNVLLKKPIILERICKFLNEPKLKEEFSKTLLRRGVTKSNSANNTYLGKTKFSNPSAKYGISVARKKVSKVELKKVFPNRSEAITNKKNLKDLKTGTTTKGEASNDRKNSIYACNGINKVTNKLAASKNSPIEESLFISSAKSIITLSAIELCEASHKLNFPSILPPENKILTPEALTSSSCNSEISDESNTCFNTGLQKTAFEVNLPRIQQNPVNQRSKWSRDNTDFLCDLPLEMTGSEMEATSSFDKVTLYQPRPHSAPHIGRKAEVDSRNVTVRASPNRYANNTLKIPNKTNNNTSKDKEISKIDDLCKESSSLSSSCLLKNQNSKTINNVASQNSDTNQNVNYEKKDDNCAILKNSNPLSVPSDKNVPCIETAQDEEKTNSNLNPTFSAGNKTYTIIDNCIMSEKTFKVNPVIKNNLNKYVFALPLISTHVLNVQNAYVTYNSSSPFFKTNNMDVHLPIVDDKKELQSLDSTKTYSLQQKAQSATSVNLEHLPTLTEESMEQLVDTEDDMAQPVQDTVLICNSNLFSETLDTVPEGPNNCLQGLSKDNPCEETMEQTNGKEKNAMSNNISICNSIAFEDAMSNTMGEENSFVQHSDSSNSLNTINKVEIGIQCDIINSNNEYSRSCSPGCVSLSDSMTAFSFRKHEKRMKYHHGSLPDLSVSEPQFDGELHLRKHQRENISYSSSQSVNKEGNDSNSELFQTASDKRFADSDDDSDIYHMCQSMNSVLHQSQDFDSLSNSSSMSIIGESNDMYSDVEELRMDLENKLGLEAFIIAYKKMQLLFESDSIVKEKRTIEEVLEPGSQHLANDLLQLIIKEDIFLNDPEGNSEI